MDDFESRKTTMVLERDKLGTQLVRAAIGFEILFVLSMVFSWWYYTECQKEKQEHKTQAAAAPSSPTIIQEHEQKSNTQEEAHEAPTVNKIGFIDYEEVQEQQKKQAQEIEKVKKEYTRVCPQCGNAFIHKSHNHTYCTRACMLEARELRSKK